MGVYRIQLPCDEKGISFTERVFECELEELSSSAFCLRSLQPSERDPESSMPLLHKGFFDSHAHTLMSARQRLCLDLAPFQSADDLIQALFEASAPDSGILQAFGWDESRLGMSLKAFVELLEKRAPNHCALFLKRVCGHGAFVNRALRELLGLHSLPSFVTEETLFALEKNLPKENRAQVKKSFLSLQEELVSFGITGSSELWTSDEDLEIYREFCDKGSLHIDVMCCLGHDAAPKQISSGPGLFFNKLSLGPNDRNACVSFRHAKYFLDGSLGARTARLSQEYEDEGGHGELFFSDHELLTRLKRSLEDGFFLALHAIGDGAVDQALKLSDMLKERLVSRVRSDGSTELLPTLHRLEHLQMLRDDQLGKLDGNVWSINLQPCHRIDDKGFLEERVGKKRLGLAHRMKSFLDRGLPVAIGTDAPISSWDPNRNLRAAVANDHLSERVSFSEALWAYTTGARLTHGIPPGKLAKDSTVFVAHPPA